MRLNNLNAVHKPATKAVNQSGDTLVFISVNMRMPLHALLCRSEMHGVLGTICRMNTASHTLLSYTALNTPDSQPEQLQPTIRHCVTGTSPTYARLSCMHSPYNNCTSGSAPRLNSTWVAPTATPWALPVFPRTTCITPHTKALRAAAAATWALALHQAAQHTHTQPALAQQAALLLVA